MNNDFLLDCAKKFPDHFLEAIKNVALTDLTLNPELRLAYLVPYKGKVKFQSSYIGKIEILTRAGVVRQIEANLVYESDIFRVSKGTHSEIIHEPNYFAANRGKIMGGYYVAILPNGEKKFDVMPKARIDDIMNRSEAVKAGKGSPWDTDFEEMAKKTIINWSFKSLPKTGISESMLKVIEIDSQSDNEEFEDWKKSQQSKGDRFDEEYAEEVK
jgi:recombination protein RecT